MKRSLPVLWLVVGGLILAAIVSRGLGLGQQPMQPEEATLAVSTAQRAMPHWPWPQVEAPAPSAYSILTSAAFGTLGLTSAAARLGPAIAGVLLVLLPLAFARRMGWVTAVLTSATLLLSTSTLAAARTASADTLAALALGLILLGALSSRPLIAGAGFGLGLTSGPVFWQGAIGLALAWPVALLIAGEQRRAIERVGDQFRQLAPMPFALGAAVVAIAAGSSFGTSLGDLGGLLAGPGEWLAGFSRSGMPFLSKLLLLPAYEPLLLFGGLAGLVLAWRSPTAGGRATTAWALTSFVMYLIAPASTGAGLIWLVLPLSLSSAIAAEAIADRMLSSENVKAAWLLAGALVTLVIFAGFSLEASIQGFGLASLDRSLQLVYAGAAVGFVVALVVLFGLAWSWREAGLGLSLALLVCLVGANLSAGWRLTHDAEETAGRELWRMEATTNNAIVLERSIESIANAHIGRAGGLDARLAGGEPPALLIWLVRDQIPASGVPGAAAPSIILAPETLDFALPADYLGQSIALIERWGWFGAAPPDLLGWWLDRRAETRTQRWVLFVRDDIAGLAEPVPIEAQSP